MNLAVNKENQSKLVDGCKVVLDLLNKYGLTNIEIAKEGYNNNNNNNNN